jgi:hypothetical protein
VPAPANPPDSDARTASDLPVPTVRSSHSARVRTDDSQAKRPRSPACVCEAPAGAEDDCLSPGSSELDALISAAKASVDATALECGACDVSSELDSMELSASEHVCSQSLEDLIHMLMSKSPPGVMKILHLFSGEANRPGSLGASVRAQGHQCLEIDTLNGAHHNLLQPRLANAVVRALQEGIFHGVFILGVGTPCNTFSVNRLHDDGGPEQLRGANHPRGCPGISHHGARLVRDSDKLVGLTVCAARAAASQGTWWVIENPPFRGPGSAREKQMFKDHLSMFCLPEVKALAADTGAEYVRFDQCAFGGKFQKWTQLLYSPELHSALGHWWTYRCSHCFKGHERVARGAASGDSAAYPAAMAAVLAQALLTDPSVTSQVRSVPLFRSGSAKPHADDATAAQAVLQAQPATSASIRRLEPETEDVLRTLPFPVTNEAVEAAWEEAPPYLQPPPARATNELIPLSMQQRLHSHRIHTGACYEAASRGRWRWAKDHRPQPLVASEDECLCHDAPRGWSWRKRPHEDLWDPITPSRWPDDPPDSELDAAAILAYAVEHGFTDMQVVAWMCHGYPGPCAQHHTVIGTPHVGALRDMEALRKCADKDRTRGWGSYGHSLPPVWPVLCDPVNIAWRQGKPRMTIDKSMQLSAMYEAYNSLINLEIEPKIDYVSVALAGRSTAILLTAGVRVRLWGLDVDAYFRKSGKQRSHWWMSGLLYWDGYGHDPRVQFGQREAPVRLGRQSTFLKFAMAHELRRLDAAYPTRAATIVEWLALRAAAAAEAGDAELYAALFYVMIFVDDVAGGSIDDELYDQGDQPWMTYRNGELVHHTRAWMHYEAVIGVLRHFGHDESAGKGVPPSLERDFLGVTEDLSIRMLYLTHAKKQAYAAACTGVLQGEKLGKGGHGVLVKYDELNSLVHKLLHASSLIVLGRQHLWHLRRALQAQFNLARSCYGG